MAGTRPHDLHPRWALFHGEVTPSSHLTVAPGDPAWGTASRGSRPASLRAAADRTPPARTPPVRLPASPQPSTQLRALPDGVRRDVTAARLSAMNGASQPGDCGPQLALSAAPASLWRAEWKSAAFPRLGTQRPPGTSCGALEGRGSVIYFNYISPHLSLSRRWSDVHLHCISVCPWTSVTDCQ